MHSRIFTHSVIGIDALIQEPVDALKNAENGIIAVFSDNIPIFYVIAPDRLAKLLDLEASLIHPVSNITLDMQIFKEPVSLNSIPMGKFSMHSDWQPDADFQRQASLWGISLTHPVTPEELTAFISWWQGEKKMFTHTQWQQKLARSLQMSRANNSRQIKSDVNHFCQLDTQIPHGFRGVK